MPRVLVALLLIVVPALAAAQAGSSSSLRSHVEPRASTTGALEQTSAPSDPPQRDQTPHPDFPGAPVMTPDLAFADASDPNPGSGRRQILAGWISTGIGVASIAQVPFCHRNEYDAALGEQVCRRLSISMAVIGLAAGIPWLVFGYQKRAAQRAWRARHGLAGWVAPLHLAVQRDGASLLYLY
jgi:hypothetical protein